MPTARQNRGGGRRSGPRFLWITGLSLALFAPRLGIEAQAEQKDASRAQTTSFQTADAVLANALMARSGSVLRRVESNADMVLQSRIEAKFRRKTSWLMFCFLPVGLMPVTFRASVEVERRCEVRMKGSTRIFTSRQSQKRTVLNQAPDPHRAAIDAHYSLAYAALRDATAEEMARDITKHILEETIRDSAPGKGDNSP